MENNNASILFYRYRSIITILNLNSYTMVEITDGTVASVGTGKTARDIILCFKNSPGNGGVKK